MNNIKYSYAYDGKAIVHIDHVAEHQEFRCISCGKKMVAKLGSKKSHHFAHKANTQSCSSETYLHKLAKTFLMQKFQTGAFEIEMKRYYLCVEAESCLFNGNCRQSDWKKYDLKEHYDSCVEEQSVDGFLADLLIAGEGRDPIFIEICVSHGCTPQKISSGHKIIEIQISSESDIEYFLQGIISEKDGVHFYGFDRVMKNKKQVYKKRIKRFVLHRSGAAIVKDISCQKQRMKYAQSSILELNMNYYASESYDYCGGDCLYDEDDYYEDDDAEHSYLYATLKFGATPLDAGLAYAVNKGLSFKNCHLCKYVRDDSYDGGLFCCMSKKYHTPCNPNQKDAGNCAYYSLNREKVQDIMPLLSSLIISEVK